MKIPTFRTPPEGVFGEYLYSDHRRALVFRPDVWAVWTEECWVEVFTFRLSLIGRDPRALVVPRRFRGARAPGSAGSPPAPR